MLTEADRVRYEVLRCTARGGGAVMRCRCGARLAGAGRARGSCRRCETARRRGLSLLALGGAAGLFEGRPYPWGGLLGGRGLPWPWALLAGRSRRDPGRPVADARGALALARERAELARAEDPIAGRARRLSLLLWVARVAGVAVQAGAAVQAPRKVCERCRGPARSARGGVVLCRLCAPSWRAARRRRALRACLAVALVGELPELRARLLAAGGPGRGSWVRRARGVLALCDLAEDAARYLG